jgi:O-antigen/teichoic acid export membrane protein
MPRVAGLVFVPIVARNLGSEELGAYQLAHLLISYALIVVFFGMSTLAVREIAQKPEQGLETFAEVLGLRLVLALLGTVGLFLLVVGMGYPQKVVVLTAVLSISLFTMAVQSSADMLFQAHERLYYSTALAAFGTVLYLLLGLPLLALDAGTLGLAVAYCLAAFLRNVAALFVVARQFGRPRISLALASQRALLVVSWPFFLEGLAVHLVNRVDVLILSMIESLEVVGWYLAAYLFLEVAMYLPAAFGQAIYPGLARTVLQAGLGVMTRRSLRAILVLTLPVPGLVALAAPELVPALYGVGFSPAVGAIQILIWSLPFMAYTSVVGHAIFAGRGQSALMLAKLAGLLFNVTANLVLIPRFSLLGTAMSTLATFVLISILEGALAVRYRCSAHRADWVPFLLPTALGWAAAGLAIQSYSWIVATGVGLLVYVSGLVILVALGHPLAELSNRLYDLFDLSASSSAGTKEQASASEQPG